MQPINIALSTYTGENLMIFGICDVHVYYQSQSQILPLLVMHGHRLHSVIIVEATCTCRFLKGEYRAYGKLDSWQKCHSKLIATSQTPQPTSVPSQLSDGPDDAYTLFTLPEKVKPII